MELKKQKHKKIKKQTVMRRIRDLRQKNFALFNICFKALSKSK